MMTPAQERDDILKKLREAATLLAGSMDPRLIPDNGAGIGYAIRRARESRDVAVIPGGLLADGGKVRCPSKAAFGADDRISRIILTAIKFDPQVRSAALIRYSEESFRILSGMYVESKETDPARHPPGIATMDWAVASCCSEGVPGVIALRGGDPKRQAICIFGEEPSGIASNIIILSNRIN